jgi:hypothetical protein
MKIRVSPAEIYQLVERLNNRSKSVVMKDQPELQKDMALAAKILNTLLMKEIISSIIELE